MTEDQPAQRPEGQLIQEALKADGRSIRQVAPLAGISDARWRQLVKGSMQVSPGVYRPEIAPPHTLARMAQVVNVTPEQLREAGREDAADALEGLRAGADSGSSAVPLFSAGPQADEIDLIYASQSMSAEQKLRAIRQVLLLRAQAEADMRKPAVGRRPIQNDQAR